MWLKQSVIHPFLNCFNLCCSIRWCSAISSATEAVMNNRSPRYSVSGSSRWHRLGYQCALCFPLLQRNPEMELCSFLGHVLGSRGSSALERAMPTLFHVCLVHASAGAGFSLWWSLASDPPAQLWLLGVSGPAPVPQPAAERSWVPAGSSPPGDTRGCPRGHTKVPQGTHGGPWAQEQLQSTHSSQAWLSRAPVAL